MICVIMKPRACSSVRGSIPHSLLSILRLYLSVFVYVSVPVYTCVRKNVYVYESMSMYASMYVYTWVIVYVRVYVCIRMSMCTCVSEREREQRKCLLPSPNPLFKAENFSLFLKSHFRRFVWDSFISGTNPSERHFCMRPTTL